MKCLSIFLVAVTVALLDHTVLAQQATRIPDEIVNELDFIAGTWVTEGKVGELQQTGKFTCDWAPTDDKKKVCLIGRFTYKTGDELRSGVTLIGWNAATKCIEDRGFDTNGGCGRLLWKVKSPTEWEGEVIMVEKGKEVKSDAILIKKGPSTIIMESENEDGVASRWVFRRVNEKQKKKADDHAQELSKEQLEPWSALKRQIELYVNRDWKGHDKYIHPKAVDWGDILPSPINNSKDAKAYWEQVEDGADKTVAYHMVPVSVVVAGDVAIINAYVHVLTKPKGKSVEKVYRLHNTWKKEDGRWQLLATYNTIVSSGESHD